MAKHSCLSAVCLLSLVWGCMCAGQQAKSEVYTFPTGERLQFLGDGPSLRFFPPPSSNCTNCSVSFKLGELAELDAFGQAIATHTIPDMSKLVATVEGGQRFSGSVSYHHVTLTLTAAKLPPSLNRNTCPSLESIMNRAYAAGIGPLDNPLMAAMAGQAAAARGGLPGTTWQAGLPAMAPTSPFGRRLQQLGRWLRPFARNPPPAQAPAPAPEGTAAAAPAAGKAADNKTAPAAAKPADSKPADSKPAPAATKPAESKPEPAAAKAADSKAAAPQAKAETKPAQAPAPAPAPPSKKEPEQAAGVIPIPQEKDYDCPDWQPECQPPAPPPPPPTPEPVPEPVPVVEVPPAAVIAPTTPVAPVAPVGVQRPAAAVTVPAATVPAVTVPAATAPAVTAPVINVPVQRPATAPLVTIPTAPVAAATPAAAATPQVPAAAAPGMLVPQLPASTAADLFRQQLAANNGYLPTPPAAALPGAQASWGTPAAGLPAGAATLPLAGAAGYPAVFSNEPPSIKITFMFGFSQNKTFAYGEGRVVSAPAGSIKYNLEIANWPFCSLYNTLKLDVVMASTAKDLQPQFVISETEVYEDSGLKGPATRRLQQAAEDAFAGFMEGEKTTTSKKGTSAINVLGLGALDMSSRATGSYKEVSTAKLLVGPKLAVASEFPTYAFASSKFTSESNVSVTLDSTNKDADAAHFGLTFSYFPQGLFYDPTVFFTHNQDMLLPSSYVATGTPAAPAVAQNCTGNGTDCGSSGSSRSRRRSNSANSQHGSSGLLLQALSAAAALLLVFVL